MNIDRMLRKAVGGGSRQSNNSFDSNMFKKQSLKGGSTSQNMNALGRLLGQKYSSVDGPNVSSKTYMTFQFNKLKEMQTPQYKDELENKHKSFVDSPLGGFLNKRLGSKKEVYDEKNDSFKNINIPAFKQYSSSDSSTPYADERIEKYRNSLNAQAYQRRAMKQRLKEQGHLDYGSYDDIKNKFYETWNMTNAEIEEGRNKKLHSDSTSENLTVLGRMIEKQAAKGSSDPNDYFANDFIPTTLTKTAANNTWKKMKADPSLSNRDSVNATAYARSALKEKMFKEGSANFNDEPKHSNKEQDVSKGMQLLSSDSMSSNKIIVKANGSMFPSKTLVQNIYNKLPSDKKVPIVFETRQQYNKEYMRNQEKQRKTKFSKDEESRYLRDETNKLQPVVSRFTTYHNKYMEPRVVVFPGKRGNADLNGDGRIDKKDEVLAVKSEIGHEVGHQLLEKNKVLAKEWNRKINPATSPSKYGATGKAEDFAESFALYTHPNMHSINNPNTNKQALNMRLGILHKHLHNKIHRDNSSKNMVGKLCYHCHKHRVGSGEDYCVSCNKANEERYHVGEGVFPRIEKDNSSKNLKIFGSINDVDSQNSAMPNLTQRQRINELPIYVYSGNDRSLNKNFADDLFRLDKNSNNWKFEKNNTITHIANKKMPNRKAYNAQVNFYQMIKQNPNLIGEIEKNKNNATVLIADVKPSVKKKLGTPGTSFPIEENGKPLNTFIITTTRPVAKKTTVFYTAQNLDMSSKRNQNIRNLFHELKHAEQNKQFTTIEDEEKTYNRNLKWENRPKEIEAVTHQYNKYYEPMGNSFQSLADAHKIFHLKNVGKPFNEKEYKKLETIHDVDYINEKLKNEDDVKKGMQLLEDSKSENMVDDNIVNAPLGVTNLNFDVDSASPDSEDASSSVTDNIQQAYNMLIAKGLTHEQAIAYLNEQAAANNIPVITPNTLQQTAPSNFDDEKV